jgi:MFS family permease
VPSEGGYGALLRNPGYSRVLSAGLASVIGSAISSVCLVWIVAVRTGSPLDVALLGTSWLVAAILFSVFGGAWVDRYDRRRLMVLADFARAVAMALVVVDLLERGFDLGVILAAYFVVGAFTTVFSPAEQAIVPSLVGVELVADANGLVRSSRSAVQFVGTAVAGALIVTVGPTTGIAVNAATFLVSGLLLLGLRTRAPTALSSTVRPSYFHDIREGFRWLYRASGFFQLTISATFFNFASNLIGAFLVFYATEVLHGSAFVFASLLAAEVAGVAIGSVLVGRTRAVRWAGRAWVVPYGVLSPIAVLAFVLYPTVPVTVVALFLVGALGGFAGTAWLTAAQLLVPTEMQGRYFGIDGLGSVAILPVAQIGGAFLITGWGVRTTYLAAAILWLAAGLVFLLPRALRELGYRPDATRRTDGAAPGTSGSPGGTRGE